jgi:flagellar biosynthesis regulator FlbT
MEEIISEKHLIFNITDEPLEAHNYNEKEQNILSRYYNLTQKPKVRKDIIPGLEKAVKEHPHIPALKNYLYTTYTLHKEKDKAKKILEETLAAHPDYFFGKVNLACEYLIENDFDKVEEIMGQVGNIKSMYPDRDVFHISEIISYEKFAIDYFIAKHQAEEALKHINFSKELSKKFVSAKKLYDTYKNSLPILRLQAGLESMKERMKHTRNVESTFKPIFEPTEDAPIFAHAEIEDLYKYGMDIPHEILSSILALPRETLIQDLEIVLADTQRRNQYYFEKNTTDVKDWDSYVFPFHALALLAELKATESLQAVLNVFRHDEKFSDFWFEDTLTEQCPYFFYALATNNLQPLIDYLLEENNHVWCRVSILKAIAQVALKNPERKQEVLQHLRFLLEYFIEHHQNEKLIDTTLIAEIIGAVLDFKATELLNLVEKTYQLDIVDVMINGDFKDVVKEINSPYGLVEMMQDLNIYELYEIDSIYQNIGEADPEEQKKIEDILKGIEHENDDWDDDDNDDWDDDDNDDWDDVQYANQPLIQRQKYPRNDKVTVKYQDGKIVKDVKFKKIEADYEKGLCDVVNE